MRLPLVTILEPLEMCNLYSCIGYGRIHEYKPVIDKMMSVDVVLDDPADPKTRMCEV
jgi:hypothetical protein